MKVNACPFFHVVVLLISVAMISVFASESLAVEECSAPTSQAVDVNMLSTVLEAAKLASGPGWKVHQTLSGKVYLLAGKGDTTQSLVDFLGGYANAKKYIGKNVDKKMNFMEGMPVELNFPAMSAALKDVSDHPEDYAKDLSDKNIYKLDEYKHGYNCIFSALSTAHGIEPSSAWRKSLQKDSKGQITKNSAIVGADDFQKTLNSSYKNISPNEAIFGKTLITFGFYHTALFLGKNRDGKVFVLTKNGNLIAPQITTIDAFTGPEAEYKYGEPRNFTLDNTKDNLSRTNPNGKFGTGYYNPK